MEFAVAHPILTALAAGAAGSVASSVFSDKPSAAPSVTPPPVTPPTPMPDETGIRRAAQRKSITEQMKRRGRASTILTDNVASDTDALGG